MTVQGTTRSFITIVTDKFACDCIRPSPIVKIHSEKCYNEYFIFHVTFCQFQTAKK